VPIEGDAHLLEVVRYIALNPVRAGLCADANSWTWGAHRALAGAAPPDFVAVADTLGYFAAWGGDGHQRYVDFVAGGKQT
jgi:hypothetical protein